jgi:hypothetical protein
VSNTTARRILKVAGILLIVAVGLVHLRGAPPHYRFAPYLGVGFVAIFHRGARRCGGPLSGRALGLATWCFGLRWGVSDVRGKPLDWLARLRTRGRQVVRTIRGHLRSGRSTVYSSIPSVVKGQTRVDERGEQPCSMKIKPQASTSGRRSPRRQRNRWPQQ